MDSAPPDSSGTDSVEPSEYLGGGRKYGGKLGAGYQIYISAIRVFYPEDLPARALIRLLRDTR